MIRTVRTVRQISVKSCIKLHLALISLGFCACASFMGFKWSLVQIQSPRLTPERRKSLKNKGLRLSHFETQRPQQSPQKSVKVRQNRPGVRQESAKGFNRGFFARNLDSLKPIGAVRVVSRLLTRGGPFLLA